MESKKTELRLLDTSTSQVNVSGATLLDVAKVAGVSPITVSRALNQPHRVRPNTVAKVQAAVRQTGYVKNMMAGALASSRTRLVALVLPNIATPIYADMVQAASMRLTKAGYQVLLGLSGYEAWQEEILLETILSRRPDGVLLTGTLHTDNARRMLQQANIPVVETWDMTPSPIDMVIGFSHEEVGHAMAHHLVERGYRRIGIISVDDPRARRRNQGLQVGLAKHGIEVLGAQVMTGPATLQLGREGTALLLDRHRDIDVIVCSSDTVAHGVLTEALFRGLQVPRQLAAMGFGDLNFASQTFPPITTVAVDGASIGDLAARAVLDRVEGTNTARGRVIDTGFKLVQRGST
jgi:LacI family gluconate utilization system Gnt-I transcriptional repressor